MSFTFKQFTINQENSAMKVGTDGVLIGAWARTPDKVSDGMRILDIGSGTGLISMMMAQRFANADIDGIDIDKGACEDATNNVAHSPFAGRISIHNTSLQDFSKGSENVYDAIVSNPPFFVDSLKCPDRQRSVARHADTLPFSQLMHNAHRLLKADGIFSIIIPEDVWGTVEAEALFAGFFVEEVCHVKTTSRKPPKRVMVALRKCSPSRSTVTTETMFIEQNQPSEWYARLTGEFYLQ